MKKMDNKGFSLVELLVVTIFVAGVLIFLFIQFSNLESSYQDSFKYNSVEGLYALEDVKEYIESDTDAYEIIKTRLNNEKYFDIKDCSIFTDQSYCEELFDFLKIKNIILIVSLNDYGWIFEPQDSDNVDTSIEYYTGLYGFNEEFKEFIKKINKKGKEPYRIVASFTNSTYATVRFGG